MTDLFPKPPKRMRQPRKDVLREQLVLAAETIIRERARLERIAPPTLPPVVATRWPWWTRLISKVRP